MIEDALIVKKNKDTNLETVSPKKEPLKKEDKLLIALSNNKQISDMHLPNKFRSFEQWELTRSTRLLYEINRTSDKYMRYPRGSIVKVDFGVNVGGEFSEQHFAITLNKKDNLYNNVITVIPLTSKVHQNQINFGSMIADMYINSLEKSVNKLATEIKNIDIKSCELVGNYSEKLQEIERILTYIKKTKDNFSYACVDQIRTVSKLNILPPINEYDIVGKVKCTAEQLKLIDDELIKKYTSINYPKFKEWWNSIND